jgi:hypothetical protein
MPYRVAPIPNASLGYIGAALYNSDPHVLESETHSSNIVVLACADTGTRAIASTVNEQLTLSTFNTASRTDTPNPP